MERTTLVLPAELKFQIQKLAYENRVSFAEFIRNALRTQIERLSKNKNSDPFFDDQKFFVGNTPADLAKNHDDYLY